MKNFVIGHNLTQLSLELQITERKAKKIYITFMTIYLLTWTRCNKTMYIHFINILKKNLRISQMKESIETLTKQQVIVTKEF